MAKTKQQTIYDISNKAGVSIATVSRVLNGSDNVSSETKKKVMAVINECKYEPNVYARGLGTGSTKTIGILCADVADLYLANAVSYLERDLRRNGFNTILNCTGYDYEMKVAGMRNMESRRVDAVILVGSQYIESNQSKNHYIIEASKDIPVMLVNGYLKADNIFCNLSDDYNAFYEATETLIRQGSRKILFLSREKSYSTSLKKKGFEDALKENGEEDSAALILQSNGKIEKIKDDIIEFSDSGNDFDSILACDDEMAMAALKYAKERGRQVPSDLMIIGCNNSVLSICCTPELSSIDNKCEMLCINTVTSLMQVLDGRKPSQKTVLSTEYIPRNTTRTDK